MLELKGKNCKDCKIFTDNIEQDALSMIYHFLDHPAFENAKIRSRALKRQELADNQQ